jgi:hypothetical protein
LRFIDIQQEATGFIAIGQIATGVFAFGQMATGIVAVGQVAVGVFTIGQGAVGVVSVGMGTVGIYWSAAMVGVAGRGFGGVIPLAPSLGAPTQLPQRVSWSNAKHDSWVDSSITHAALKVPEGVRIRASLRKAIEGSADCQAVAHVVDGAVGLEVDRVIHIPRPRYLQPSWWGVWATQFSLFVLLCAAYVGGFLVPWGMHMWAKL